MLGCIGVVACGGGEDTTPAPAPATPSTPPADTMPTPAPATPSSPPADTAPAPSVPEATSGGGLTWDDIPVYAGADQVQKGSWAIPPAEGDWARVEWRYYETSGNVSAVTGFYKSQMPAKGWQEAAWVEVQDMGWGLYNKNDEKDAAMVWVGSEEGKTFFALMRASQ